MNISQVVSRVLLHSLWEGAAIACLLAVLLTVFRNSRLRYFLACLAMTGMVASFIVTFAVLARGSVVGTSHFAGAHYPAVPLAVPSGYWTTRQTEDPFAWMAPLWFVGVLFFYSRGAMAWVAARRLRVKGVCVASQVWLSRLDILRDRIRVSRSVAMFESALAEVPSVVGWMRPVILVPVGLLAGLPALQIDAILLHELAHIRRRDYLVNLLQTVVEGLLFYHPAVWWIADVIRTERENCCDDLVTLTTGDSRGYAEALATLENRRVGSTLALAANQGGLLRRIRRLLGERQTAIPNPIALSACLAILIGAALLVAADAPQPPAQVAPTPVPAATAPPPFVEQFWLRRDPSPAQLPQSQTPANNSAQSGVLPYKKWISEDVAHIISEEERAAFQERATSPAPAAQSQPAVTNFEYRIPLIRTDYTKWLTEDVVYIILDSERTAFQNLTTDAERDRFIEQFWSRRDPTPGTPLNEFKEEHYRRIGYANQHFASTVAGWRTDRGRIYIQYGPPNELESHASGGLYQRPASEGGGLAQTYPFEQWRYRFIEGIGQNVTIEFVDKTGNNEYHMTKDPSEKNR